MGITVMTSVAALLAAALWLSPLARPLTPPQQASILTVQQGENLDTLLHRLQQSGWDIAIAQTKLYARILKLDKRIRSGDYSLADGCCANTPDLLQLLTDGTQLTHRLTLIEGRGFKQMMATLAAVPKLQHDIASEPEQAARQLGLGYESAEGLFHPDTYDFASGESERALLLRARRRQRELLAQLWSTRSPDLPYETPYEALILASIVEREARLREEAPLIAGVYVARLRRGQRLEADPTVIYGLGNDYRRRLTRADLRTPTPWNTYMNRGLPPTPIGAPGETSLRAALAPKESGMLYFVARGDGGHIFAATLEEHIANVRMVRKQRSTTRK